MALADIWPSLYDVVVVVVVVVAFLMRCLLLLFDGCCCCLSVVDVVCRLSCCVERSEVRKYICNFNDGSLLNHSMAKIIIAKLKAF